MGALLRSAACIPTPNFENNSGGKKSLCAVGSPQQAPGHGCLVMVQSGDWLEAVIITKPR